MEGAGGGGVALAIALALARAVRVQRLGMALLARVYFLRGLLGQLQVWAEALSACCLCARGVAGVHGESALRWELWRCNLPVSACVSRYPARMRWAWVSRLV